MHDEFAQFLIKHAFYHVQLTYTWQVKGEILTSHVLDSLVPTCNTALMSQIFQGLIVIRPIITHSQKQLSFQKLRIAVQSYDKKPCIILISTIYFPQTFFLLFGTLSGGSILSFFLIDHVVCVMCILEWIIPV